MKLSARNQIKGRVIEVREGATTAHVRVKVARDIEITASITNEAVQDLRLKRGDKVLAVVKASDVIIAK